MLMFGFLIGLAIVWTIGYLLYGNGDGKIK